MNIKQDNVANLLDLVRQHESWMDDTINLIASENRLSPLVKDVLQSDLGNRVAEGWVGERVFPGIRYYDEIESYGMALARDMFHADFADIRPISGSMANMIVFSAFTSPGDTIVTLSISSGAHISMAGATAKKVFGLNVVSLPFNPEDFVIEIEAAIALITELKPKMVILGGSVLLFRQPTKELARVCHEVGSILLFDASHIAGLIASGDYPNPLDDGADIMTMTVCKTLPGPQHALIFSKKDYAERLKKTTFPGFLSGHHLHETAATIVMLEEFKLFGKEYSSQVLRNTKALARALAQAGFTVAGSHKGFTQTHMLLLDISEYMDASEAEKLLEDANIITNRNLLPRDSSFLHPSGIRLGAPEMTRLGATEADMKDIASFFKRLFIDKEAPADVKRDVAIFRRPLQKSKYCYRTYDEANQRAHGK